MTNILIPKLTCLVSTGRPDRSTELEVGQPRRAQNVHAMSAGGPVDRPGRPQRASALWKAPVDRAGRPAESSALCIPATVDRPVDCWLNGQKSDRWPVDRAIDRRVILAPNG